MTVPILDIVGLNKFYGALQATRDVNLSVNEGEIHALIGPNGAGKTTLINQIYGSEQANNGRIFLNNHDVTSANIAQRIKRGIGRSFQISNVLLNFSLLENAIIAEQARLGQAFRFFAPAFADRALIEGATHILARVGLTFDVHRRVADISHGERRLLELALAIAASPSLLLLDEPMAGAGAAESLRMMDVIKSLRGDNGILLIEHDMDAVFKLADRITVLVEGAVIACGSPSEISRNKAVRAAYLGSEE